ncbi:28S ribosomal protein S31, mitochondrial [Mugil cephalus]|uniref:28S ribosomal protein S31, mitochondrial n=1 Tax=Mugil cephalus TaxID=48193 RepID=UPI001FB5E743|nr:28S ribosomal protein S31, mitochondrial [Mugil cephalus]
MYRFLFRTGCAARNSSVILSESGVLTAKCDKAAAPVFRVANGGGVKLSTSSIRLCEKKDNVPASNQGEKADGGGNEDAALSESTQTKMVAQNEDPVALKANDGCTTQPEMDVRIEQVVAKPTQVKADEAKNGKQNLLNLLGAMKVEVTNKRKLKSMKAMQSSESPTQYKSKPAAMESTISMFQKASVDASQQSETLDPNLVAAASAAASTLPDSSRAESELLRQLRQRKAITEAQKQGRVSDIGEIITDMKVGRKKSNRVNVWPTDQIQFDEDGRGYTKDRGITSELAGVQKRRGLFKGKRLNIFSSTADNDGVDSAVAKPTLWDVDFANQLSQSTNRIPRNGFEELIQLTKEGKLWQYPINNEDGLEEEASVSFHEHIFLEKHLEEGFPRQGPVRHFMELVVIGLSKNPYLTVQQKKEHIFWFRDYFQEKEKVLKEANVSS